MKEVKSNLNNRPLSRRNTCFIRVYKSTRDLLKKQAEKDRITIQALVATYCGQNIPSNISPRLKLEQMPEYIRNKVGKVTKQRINQLLNPQQQHTREKTLYLIKKGEIKKQPCFYCGDTKVQCHHKDYADPTAVMWLCSKHHADLHAHLRFDKSKEYVPTE